MTSVELKFPIKEPTLAYARQQGLSFSVSEQKEAERPRWSTKRKKLERIVDEQIGQRT
jgi:hypothetical protein